MTESTDREQIPLRVGAAQWTIPGILRFARYQSGEIAIEILTPEGEQQLVATVALVPYGAPRPGEYGLWLKGWSENEGVPEALVQAGVVTLTGRKHRTGHAEALHAELTEIGRAALVQGLEAERAQQARIVHREIDQLVQLNVLTAEKANRVKQLLTQSVIDGHIAQGLGVHDIIDLHVKSLH